MSAKTNYLQSAVLNAVARNTAYSTPTTVYVALFTAAPTDAYTSGVPTGTEVTGNAYARQSITFGAPSGTPRVISNSSGVVFPAATPGAWGTITSFGIFDALTNGNLLYWADLTSSKIVGITDVFQFASGAVTLTEN